MSTLKQRMSLDAQDSIRIKYLPSRLRRTLVQKKRRRKPSSRSR